MIRSSTQYLLAIIIIVIIILLPLGLIIHSDYQMRNSDSDLRRMDDTNPNSGILLLTYENSSKSYSGFVGPIMLKNSNKKFIEGAKIELSIDEQKVIGITNAVGMTTLNIPENIVNSTDLSQKYSIKATHMSHHDLSWKVKIEIKND